MNQTLNSKTPQFNQNDLLKRLSEDESFFIQSCLKVKDKTGQVVRFFFNQVQKKYEKLKTNFDIILKSRKLGISTRIIAGDIWACAFKKNQHAILIAQNGDEAVKFLEERVKPLLQNSVMSLGGVERAEHVYFPATDSRYYIGAAGAKRFGRGSDITRYHLTEYAWWEKPDVLTGIEEGIVDNTVGRIETTANGANFFFQHWKSASSGKGRYKPIFIPWFWNPEYSLAGQTISNPNEEEMKLIQTFGLTQEQLAWRRWKIENMSRPELFYQEYPSCPEEAFLSSGRMLFDWTALLKHENCCQDPKWRGYLRDMGESIELIPNEHGGLSVWESPQPKHVYVIGADIAEGLKDGAYSAAFVLDVGNSVQVAEWHGHVAPDAFADVLATLGVFYNTALLAPEAWPGVGAVTTSKILDLGYRNIYKRQPGSGHRTNDQLWGWETNVRTRQDLLLTLAGEAMREMNLTVRSKALIEEMRNLVYDESGSIIPQVGTFVDRVFAAGIAWKVAREIASGIHYNTPKLREIEFVANKIGAVSAPVWKGRRYGTRT